jgi:hypothetical protein
MCYLQRVIGSVPLLNRSMAGSLQGYDIATVSKSMDNEYVRELLNIYEIIYACTVALLKIFLYPAILFSCRSLVDERDSPSSSESDCRLTSERPSTIAYWSCIVLLGLQPAVSPRKALLTPV